MIKVINFGLGINHNPSMADRWYATLHWYPYSGMVEPYNINVVYNHLDGEIRHRVESPWASSSEDFDPQPALPLETIRNLLARLVEATSLD